MKQREYLYCISFFANKAMYDYIVNLSNIKAISLSELMRVIVQDFMINKEVFNNEQANSTR
ncbi:MAG: hypothetical protein HQK91_08550 [Nitrospirae bacterium]|nr:hypothetical protein [Nitrospirota bacterium]